MGPTTLKNLEYYGNIYQIDSNGKFSFTNAEQGYRTSSWFDPKDIPDDTEYAGYYHTHPSPPPGYDSEHPSGAPGDIGIVYSQQNQLFPNYIGTAGGRILLLDPLQFPTMGSGCVLLGPAVTEGTPIPVCPK